MKALLSQLLRRWARSSRLLAALGFRLRGIRPLPDLEALDAHFGEAKIGESDVTPDDLRRLGKAYLKLDGDFRMPADPFSAEYAARQQELYARVATQAYQPANEATPFDFEATKNDFFPYNTRSPEFVGVQLLSQGLLIRNLDLKPGARIVEFGAGWGNTTLQLALMGYRMTVVELNRPSIALMRHRAGLHGKHLEFAEQDMVEFAQSTRERFDAALFVASFHHCHDHLRLLEQLGRILEPDGRIYFTDEPVFPASTPALPYPWGLRLDGPSLYYVRKHGWLELGFREDYFRAALARQGWQYRTVPSPIAGLGDLIIASRRS